ncbi:hypothetical protein ACRAWD_03735 [Caulobacter segnis]
MVGGTGLYFRALTHGLAGRAAGARDPARDLRLALCGQRRGRVPRDPETLDPEAEASHRRLATASVSVRAHAVAVATGKSLTAWQTDTKPALRPGD